jgi:hypothetical protein
MNRSRIATMTMLLLLTVPAYAANPFLNAQDDKPVFAKFRGTDWGDEIQQDEIPLTARVVTTRVAKNAVGRDFQSAIHGSKIAH